MAINDQHQQPKWNMKILIIFSMVISTAIITLLYKIQSGQITSMTTISSKNVYRTTHNESTANGLDKLIVLTIPNTITNTTINVTDDQIVRKHDTRIPTFVSKSKSVLTNEKESKNDYTSEVTSRYLNNDITGNGEGFVVGPSISSGIKVPSIIKENSTNQNAYSINHYNGKNTSVDNNNNENNKTEIIYESRMYQTNKRQMSHDDYPNTNVEQLLSDEDASNSYYNTYDLTNNVNDYKGNQNPVYGTGWTTAGHPEQLHSGESLSSDILGDSISWDQPFHIPENHKPKAHPSVSLTKHQKQKENIINWRIISVLAFIKLGLAKLQTIGFLNMLFLLGFKFKLFFLALLLKFLLLLKLMKFLNIVKLPLLVLQLLPTLMQLLSMVGQLIMGIRRGTNMPLNESNGLLSSVVQPAGTTSMITRIPGTTTNGNIIQGPTIPNRVPNLPNSNTIPGQTIRSGMTMGTHSSDVSMSNRIQSETGLSDFQLNDLNYVLNGGHNESFIQSYYEPTFGIFEKILDLEKCVERIACRIAGVEKAGIMPLWTHYWVLHRVPNLIPTDKLETYLKTYKDVKYNKMYTKLMTPENWASWCLERYNCNSDKTSNVTDTNE